MADAKHLTADQIRAIEKTLTQDHRVELIPTRDGIKMLRVRRDEIK